MVEWAQSTNQLTNKILKPGLGQNIATRASPTGKNFYPVLISSFPVDSLSFFPNPLSIV